MSKLALYEPPFIVDDSRHRCPADYVTHLETLVSEGRRGDAVAYFLTTGPGVPAEVVESMRGEEYWPSLEAVAHTLAYEGTDHGGTRWAEARNRSSGGPRSRVPTLVMDGGASPPWQRAAVRALASVLPDARQRTLADQDHGPADDVLAPVLADFFAG